MKKVLILGHKGMLGDAVFKYFTKDGTYEIATISTRWPEEAFTREFHQASPNFIINCIGKIPQRVPSENEYTEVNINLPIFLETLEIPILHPSTDCEFSGKLSPGALYTKSSTRDAEDQYGKSKALISEKIEHSFKNTKIIRTSIIGHESSSSVSLLDWFLHAEGEVKGYTNHFWNGVTTLQWAQLAKKIISDWESYPVLNQYGTSYCASKYEVLSLAKEVYSKNIVITPFEAPTTINKCIESDAEIPDLRQQLEELKTFYAK